MSFFTFHTGSTGDELTIIVEWYDHDNALHHNELAIRILDQDKPRTLQVLFDGVELARVAAENSDWKPIETRKEAIVSAEWQYHEMLRHGAQPPTMPTPQHGAAWRLDAEGYPTFDTPTSDAVAAWNKRRVAEPDAPWPYDVQSAYQNTLLPQGYERPMLEMDHQLAMQKTWQLFPKPGAIYPGVGYVDAGMA